jgi:hypothetical protein
MAIWGSHLHVASGVRAHMLSASGSAWPVQEQQQQGLALEPFHSGVWPAKSATYLPSYLCKCRLSSLPLLCRAAVVFPGGQYSRGEDVRGYRMALVASLSKSASQSAC